jgi:hypothetical protein
MTFVRASSVVLTGQIFTLAGLCAVAAYSAQPPSVEEIIKREKEIIQSRTGIRSGRVVLTRTIVSSREPMNQGLVQRYVTYFDGDKMRADVNSTSPLETAFTKTVFTKDTFIREGKAFEFVQVYGALTRPKSTIEVPDPRRLGLIAWTFSTISQLGFEVHFVRPDRDQFRVEAGIDGGEPIWKVRYRIPRAGRPAFGEYWLAPKKGGMPIYIEVSGGEGNQSTKQSVKVNLRQYGPNGIWFPEQVVFRYFQGASVVDEEVDSVEEAVFGESVPDRLFTVAGLGLPKGRVVSLDGDLMIWSGERLSPKIHGEDDALEEVQKPSWNTSRIWLIALNSIVLACIAAALLWFRWRRSKKSAGPSDG